MESTRRKILWHSNAPWATTGYGMQTAAFAPRLRESGFDVALAAFYGLEGGIGSWEGMTVYPTDHTRLGKHMLRKYAEDHGQGEPVEVVTLCDTWPWLDARFGGIADFKGLNITSWVPVDHDPPPPRVMQALETFQVKPIAMSRFGQDRLTDAGLKDVKYAPHGIDTNVLKPEPEKAALLRESMGISQDAFVVGMVANNAGTSPSRKSFPQVFQAFAAFRDTHPDSYLYLHTEVMGSYDGLNLLALAQISGVPEDAFIAVGQDKYSTGTITQEHMAAIYSMMDVLANPAHGEGFGVPIIEAQACGTPVVVTDWTAMPELCGAGWIVKGDRWYNASQGSFFMCPSVFEIVEAFEQAYDARGDKALFEEARRFALGYDADLVATQYLVPAIEEILAERAAVKREPPVAFKPNRAMRRAAKGAA